MAGYACLISFMRLVLFVAARFIGSGESTIMNYELVDFGEERKLERFGAWVLDRPAPGVETAKSHPSLWTQATAYYTGNRTTEGCWEPAIDQWTDAGVEIQVTLSHETQFKLSLAPLPSGQIGLFPEQFENWQWIFNQSRKTPALRVLNLFAYTGGSTLAAATAGAHVTHVDAARSMVARARDNAQRSGMAETAIRWVVEDALKFCQREVRRGNQYDAIILDPPSYGHGPKGEKWSIKRDLLPLLKLCGELTGLQPKFALLTCHTPAISATELGELLSGSLCHHADAPPQTGSLHLKTASGSMLASGDYARWSGSH